MFDPKSFAQVLIDQLRLDGGSKYITYLLCCQLPVGSQPASSIPTRRIVYGSYLHVLEDITR